MGQGRVYTTAIIVSVMLVCALVLGARWHALGQRVPLMAGAGSAASVALAQSAALPDSRPRKPAARRAKYSKPAAQPSAPQASPPKPAAATAGPVDINTATAAQLELLPGIGPVLAARIVEYRTAHGPFAALEGLLDVSGIGEKKLAALRGRAVCSSGK